MPVSGEVKMHAAAWSPDTEGLGQLPTENRNPIPCLAPVHRVVLLRYVAVHDHELAWPCCDTDVVRTIQPALVNLIWITSRPLLPVLEIGKRPFVPGTQRK